MNNLHSPELDDPRRDDSLQAIVASHRPDLLVDLEPFEDNTTNGLRVYGIKSKGGTDTDNVLWQIQPDGGYPTTLVTHGNEFEFNFQVLQGTLTVLVHRQGVLGVNMINLSSTDYEGTEQKKPFALKSGDTFALVNEGDTPCVVFDQGNKPFEEAYEEPLNERNGLDSARAVAALLKSKGIS